MRRRRLGRGEVLFLLMDTAIFVLVGLSSIAGESAPADANSGISTPAPFDIHSCVARLDGIHADPFDCHRYYHCVRKKTFYFRCFDGFVFDPCRRRCIYQSSCVSASEPCPTTTNPASVTDAIKGKEISKNALHGDQRLDLQVGDEGGADSSKNASLPELDRSGKNESASAGESESVESGSATSATTSHQTATEVGVAAEGTTAEGASVEAGHGANANATESTNPSESEIVTASDAGPTPTAHEGGGESGSTKPGSDHEKATTPSILGTTGHGGEGAAAAAGGYGQPPAAETRGGSGEAVSGVTPPAHQARTYLVRVVFNRRLVSHRSNGSAGNGESKELNVDVTPKPWLHSTKPVPECNRTTEKSESEPATAEPGQSESVTSPKPESEHKTVEKNETKGSSSEEGKGVELDKASKAKNESAETEAADKTKAPKSHSEATSPTPSDEEASKKNCKNESEASSSAAAEKSSAEKVEEKGNATKSEEKEVKSKETMEKAKHSSKNESETGKSEEKAENSTKSNESKNESETGKSEEKAENSTKSKESQKQAAGDREEKTNASKTESEESSKPRKNETEASESTSKVEKANNKCSENGHSVRGSASSERHGAKNSSGEAEDFPAPALKDKKKLLQSLKNRVSPPLNFRFLAGQAIVAKLEDLLGEINVTTVCRTPPIASNIGSLCQCPETNEPALADESNNSTDSKNWTRSTAATERSLRRHCRSLTCYNGAMYVELSNGQCGCLCPVGWRGDRCQHLIDHSICNCANGGRCAAVGNGTYACLCPLGYSGGQCQYPYPASNSNENEAKLRLCDSEAGAKKCENGGICLRDDTKARGDECFCPSGFSGDSCQNKS